MPRTGLTAPELAARAIDAALARIRAHGFEKVRLTDVAHDLGISHASLYEHFAHKEALLDAVIEAWLAEMSRALETTCVSAGEPSRKVVRWFVAQYVQKRDCARTDRAVYAAFASANVAQKPFVRAYLRRRTQQLVSLLEPIAARLTVPVPDAAAVLLAGMDGFLHPKLVLDGAARNRERELRAVLEALLRGLGVAPGRKLRP